MAWALGEDASMFIEIDEQVKPLQLRRGSPHSLAPSDGESGNRSEQSCSGEPVSCAARTSCETRPDETSKPSPRPTLWLLLPRLHTYIPIISQHFTHTLSKVSKNIHHAEHPRNGHKRIGGGWREACVGLSPRVSGTKKHFVWH